ncbi:MAG: bifunctional 23S rRNA (guanine(2069)-N(7))-methyltransferase RlmK/23S rRNA (guanine(2445)-N(2))-methyltransferase RlmL [Planctomycetota bacterium]
MDGSIDRSVSVKRPEAMTLVAACGFGLEAVAKRELESLGFDAKIETAGRVHFAGGPEAIVRCNLWLRTADRILIEVARFPAPDFDALFESTKWVYWASFLDRDAIIHVTGRSSKSALSSVPACQRCVKRAIVDALKSQTGTSELTETGAKAKVDVAIFNDEATLTIDTTGRSLHRRGYRTDIGGAPLKETLAAALVMLSFWKPGRALLDPFCGSGTIPIEAARISANLAPGLDRDFAFEGWSWVPNELVADTRSDARKDQVTPEITPASKLIGRDFDGRILKAARENAIRAGVADQIHFQQGDFRSASSKHRFGCLVTNPPYGMRLGADGGQRSIGHSRRSRGAAREESKPQVDPEIESLYAGLPDLFRSLPTWSHYVLTGYSGLERIVGREADRRRKLYNGRIETAYYQFHGPRPVKETRALPTESTESVASVELTHAEGPAAFGELGPKTEEQCELFAARLRKRARHLRRYPTRRGITCYRIYERDVPEIPLVVDRYEDALHITEYERPHDRDVAAHANWLERMAEVAGKTLEIAPTNVHLKTRRRQIGRTQHEKIEESNDRSVVNEGGLKFWVNLRDYVDTGLFLDHRITRNLIREEANGKRFLNLFAYTGSFTVYAAQGGASQSLSVDLSRTYLDWAWANLKLNGLDAPQHQLHAGDIREFLQQHPPGEHYDLAVVDPPTFSNSKRTEHDWNVQRDALPMIHATLDLMSPGGVLFFSNNFRRFKLDESAINASEVHEISKHTIPDEYRNRRIHRCWRIVK